MDGSAWGVVLGLGKVGSLVGTLLNDKTMRYLGHFEHIKFLFQSPREFHQPPEDPQRLQRRGLLRAGAHAVVHVDLGCRSVK